MLFFVCSTSISRAVVILIFGFLVCLIRARQQEQSKGEDDESRTAALGGSLGLDESDVFNQSWPITGKITSSESEYSDTEGGQTSKLRSLSGKVRHASLGCLHSVFKVRSFWVGVGMKAVAGMICHM